ncbi:MAG: hypothetical protein ACM3OO_10050 [Planctomycetaceae bacterium]
MSDEEKREYVAPPPPPLFGRGGTGIGQNPKRMSGRDLEAAVERHQQEEQAETGRIPWWKRLFGRS